MFTQLYNCSYLRKSWRDQVHGKSGTFVRYFSLWVRVYWAGVDGLLISVIQVFRVSMEGPGNLAALIGSLFRLIPVLVRKCWLG